MPLIDSFQAPRSTPLVGARIKLELGTASRSMHITSCHLYVHARLTGLMYMMYYWPITSTLVGIGVLVLVQCTVIALVIASIIYRLRAVVFDYHPPAYNDLVPNILPVAAGVISSVKVHGNRDGKDVQACRTMEGVIP